MTPGRKLDRTPRRLFLAPPEALAKRLLDDRGQSEPLPCSPLLGFGKEMVVQADRRPHDIKACQSDINMSRSPRRLSSPPSPAPGANVSGAHSWHSPLCSDLLT